MSATRPKAPPSPLVFEGLSAVALVVIAASVWISATSDVHEYPLLVAGTRGIVLATWYAAGLLTWERRPDTRFGPLMIVTAFVWSITGLTGLENPVLFSVGALVWAVSVTLAVAVIAAFPDGRVTTRNRTVIVATGALNGLAWGAAALGTSSIPTIGAVVHCSRDCPRNPFRVVEPSAALTAALTDAVTAAAVAVGLAVLLVLVSDWRSATHARRHVLRPPIIALFALAGAFTVGGVLRNVEGPDAGITIAALWLVPLALAAFPALLLVSQARARLFAGGSLRRFVAQLSPGGTHRELEAAIAQALDDPSLRLAFFVAPAGYVDLHGDPVDVSDPALAVTEVRDGGDVVAAIVHDPVLREPFEGVVEGAGAAVLLALENARLEAEVRSSARELRESRARILAAGMSERRRLERDLHDTAQQRLVMLRVKLDLAETRAGPEAGEVRALLRRLGDEVEETIDGLRDVARGLYPLFLEEQGLEAALRREVRSGAPAPTLAVRDIGRSRRDIEVAVYICCREALSLLELEAAPDEDVRLEVGSREGWLRIHVTGEVSGRGLAARVAAQLRDPVVALGGRADFASSADPSWTVTAYIPWPPPDPKRAAALTNVPQRP